jgi:AMMECR1 domain-containing protein
VTVDEIDPAAHGLCLRLGRHGAVLLPQVAARYRWDRMTLLVQLCEKGGLPPTAWQDPEATLLAFTVETVEGALIIG